MTTSEIIATILASIGGFWGIDRGIKIIIQKQKGKNGDNCFTRADHDRECELKLMPIRDDIKEIKQDVKILLKCLRPK